VADLMAAAYERALTEYAAGCLADLGCGAVPLYLVYRSKVTSVVCVDWASSMHQRSHVDITHDLNEPLPLADRTFDTVVLSDVLEHIYEPKALLQESARILRPDGALVIGVPFMYWIHEAPHDYYRFTEHCIRRMLTDCGLEVIHFERVGGAFEVAADLFVKGVSEISERLCSLIAGMAIGISRSNLGHRMRHHSQLVTPLGYVAVAKKAAMPVVGG
jgi:SAM-dependent methyltransferase